MTAFACKCLRVVGVRILIVAVSAALLCSIAGQQPTGQRVPGPKTLSQDVIETASIVQLPTTIGSADSDLYNRSQADVEKTLDVLQAMGVQNVRIIVPWAGVQPFSLPLYNWGSVDRMVNAAAERNMGVLAVINSTPRWAGRPYLSGHPTPEAFADFAGLVANRYEGKIAAYEVWNEPNALTFWNPVDPAAYTEMLKAGYTAIKAADSEALVVGGVVASLFSALDVTINPQDFVAAMYDNGAKGYFDAISFHPYHFHLEFSESGTHPAGALNQLEKIRDVMIENGDEELKIWATEYGLPTAVSSGEAIDEQYQADFIEDFLRSWAEQDGTGPVYIYSTRDTLSGDPDIQKNFGFFYTDWTPKEAAFIIAQFAGGGVSVPEEPDRPILDAAVAIARAIVDATVRVINGGVQLFAAAVDITVQVIRGLVDLGVRVVRGLANAAIDVVDRVIDGIRDRVGPDDEVTTDNNSTTQQFLRTVASDEPSAGDATAAVANSDSTETDITGSQTASAKEETESDVVTESTETGEGTDSDENAENTGSEDETTNSEDEAETNETDESTAPEDTADDATFTEPAEPSVGEESDSHDVNDTADTAETDEKASVATSS